MVRKCINIATHINYIHSNQERERENTCAGINQELRAITGCIISFIQKQLTYINVTLTQYTPRVQSCIDTSIFTVCQLLSVHTYKRIVMASDRSFSSSTVVDIDDEEHANAGLNANSDLAIEIAADEFTDPSTAQAEGVFGEAILIVARAYAQRILIRAEAEARATIIRAEAWRNFVSVLGGAIAQLIIRNGMDILCYIFERVWDL